MKAKMNKKQREELRVRMRTIVLTNQGTCALCHKPYLSIKNVCPDCEDKFTQSKDGPDSAK